MTDTTTLPAVKPEVPQVTANPGLLDFPQDKWGYTSKMRKEMLLAAGSIKGQPDKAKLYLQTLDLIRAHVLARYALDKDVRAQVGKDAEHYASLRHEYKGRGRP
jgi:hypothetical protein